jgi:NAD+ diphosphatase
MVRHTGTFSTDFLEPVFPEPETIPPVAAWVLVQGDRICVSSGDPPLVFSDNDPKKEGIAPASVQYLGHHGTVPRYAAEIPAGFPAPQGMEYIGVRDLFGRIPDEELAIAAFAVRIIDFDRTTRFCGRCGAKTRQLRTERSRLCTACNLITYPRLSPAVVVLVRRGDQILLARSPRFPPGMYSLMAGFVEPGENLEHAIEREVKEETGISIQNMRYFGSEPWPFPNSLMIGYVADYLGGDIVIDDNEIESAFWFDRKHLPRIPEKLSISRALIDWWMDNGKLPP